MRLEKQLYLDPMLCFGHNKNSHHYKTDTGYTTGRACWAFQAPSEDPLPAPNHSHRMWDPVKTAYYPLSPLYFPSIAFHYYKIPE